MEIKVKPTEKQSFKTFEITTKNWNLKTRKEINNLVANALSKQRENSDIMFETYCSIIEKATNINENEAFNMSTEEIQSIAYKIIEEINKKKE